MLLDRHLDLIPLRDGDLELHFPAAELCAGYAHNTRHDLVARDFPQYHDMTVEELRGWMPKVGHGRHINRHDQAPVYWLWVCLRHADGAVEVIGDLELRITTAAAAVIASGHVGYHMLPQFRNRGLTTRAVVLAKTVFRAHGFDRFIITCAPGNAASRRVAEKAGGALLEIRRYSDGELAEYRITTPEHCRYAVAT